MSLQTICPHCQAVLSYADNLRGPKVRCPKCARVFVIEEMPPEQEAAIQPEARSWTLEGHENKEQALPECREVFPKRLPTIQRRRGWRGLLLALVAATVGAAAGGTGVWWWVAGPRRQPAAEGDAEAWPEAGHLLASRVPPPPDRVITLHVVGVMDDNSKEALEDDLWGSGYSAQFARSGERTTVVLTSGFRDPPTLQAMVKRIKFGTVLRVDGRVITIRAHRAQALSNSERVTKALDALKSDDHFERLRALAKLKRMRPTERHQEVARALEPLLLDKGHFSLRGEVAEVLGVWGGKENVPALLKALNSRDDRQAVIAALGQLKDERAAEPLARLLENPFDQHFATEALQDLGPVGEKAVCQRLRHPDHWVRRSACEVLKVIGTRQSLPHLQAILATQDVFIVRDAQEAIQAIRARR